MRLVNRTRWPAILQVANLQTEDLSAVVIIKRTYDIVEDGHLRPADEPLPVSPDFLETPYGIFHGDHFIRKKGADVAVLGTIRRLRPVTRARVSITIGSIVRELRVLGDRTWKKTGRAAMALSPTAPTPFTEMPISYKRAYGGSADFAGYQASHPENPWGIGFYLEAEQAVDHQLPNIEDAASSENYQWSDRQPVAGFAPYPMIWGLRAQEAITIAADKKSIQSVSPLLFNNAHPKLVVDRISPSETIAVQGLDEKPLAITLPSVRLGLEVNTSVKKVDVESRIDGVYIWSDARKVVITNRANFSYQFQSEQTRQATLLEVGESA